MDMATFFVKMQKYLFAWYLLFSYKYDISSDTMAALESSSIFAAKYWNCWKSFFLKMSLARER